MADIIEVDQGEWCRIDWDASADPSPWDDLAGATISLDVKVNLEDAAVAFVCPAGELDPPDELDGKVKTGGVILPVSAPAGTYWATMTVDKNGDRGWPQKTTFTLKINPVTS